MRVANRTEDSIQHVEIEQMKDGNYSIENIWNISVPHLIHYLTTKQGLTSDGQAVQLLTPYTTVLEPACQYGRLGSQNCDSD